MEEDVEDASNGSAEVWDESLEAPFWFNSGNLPRFEVNKYGIALF